MHKYGPLTGAFDRDLCLAIYVNPCSYSVNLEWALKPMFQNHCPSSCPSTESSSICNPYHIDNGCVSI